ncbi:Ig-like domain-containing protein [Stieleria sp. JC731]|uniref:Calx-beta domain-containing protein n=1 Tax=Pirellulaceae TaxID=2691357 RepID=UPI001E33F9B1|nr:Calx-beta domain-containing protein [Stieleria sp. JC731]MCC9600963.1 Ig-like domain-containing protein [Stieleria sp. JC731]
MPIFRNRSIKPSSKQRVNQRKKAARRRLQAELLEDRRLLAATVLYENFEPPGYTSGSLEGSAGGPINSPNGSYAKKFGNFSTQYYSPPRRSHFYADLSGFDSAYVEFDFQPGGGGDMPESEDHLFVDYRRVSDRIFWVPPDWQTRLLALNPTGYSSTAFTHVKIDLPADALHQNFELEFDYGQSDYGGLFSSERDNWFIDNLRIVANRRPTLSLSSPTGIRTDDDLPLQIVWSGADADGDNLSGLYSGNVITVTRDGEMIESSSSRSGSIAIDPTDLVGSLPQQYVIQAGVSDGTSSRELTRSFTLIDDDIEPPVIQVGGSEGSEAASTPQAFNWSTEDDSGSASRVIVTRNGEAIFSREYTENISGDSFNFDSYGIGTYELFIEATDLDQDRDNDRLTSTATRIVNVLNSLPTPSMGIATPIVDRKEGHAVEFSGSGSSDPDGDSLKYIWNFGDGTLMEGESVFHVFPDDGDYEVKLTVVDPYGGIGETITHVTISNVVPSALVTPLGSPEEAREYSIELTLVDPGEDKTAATIQWGDNTETAVTASGTYSHVYASGGTNADFRVLLQDEDGDYGEQYTSMLTVQNIAPAISGLPSYITAHPGESILFDVLVTDGANDTLSYLWDFDGDTVSGSDLQSVSHTFTADGLYPVSLQVTDSDGFTSTAGTVVAVGAPLSFSVSEQSVTEDVGSLSVEVSLDNGIGLATHIEVPLVVSGTAHGDDAEVGTLLIPAGATTATVSVDITNDLLSESTEMIELAIGAVAGVSAGVIPTHTIRITDNDDVPTAYFSATGGVFAEQDQKVTLVASLSEPAGRDVQIPVMFTGSVTIGSDFQTPSSMVITVPAGATSSQFDLLLVDDTERELAENLIVEMQQPIGADLSTTSGQSTRAVVTIPQNDAPEIRLDSAYRITSEDVSELYLTARLSAISDQAISVPYSISGTAENGEDFFLLDGSILFLPGSLESSLRVNINDDLIDEPIEYFAVQLEDPGTALLGTSRTIVTEILDNDIASVSFSTETIEAFEDESSITVNVVLSNPLSQAVTIPIVVKGTAVEGIDYTLSTTSVTFDPLETSKSITVNLLDDSLNEPTDNLYLQFGDVSGVAVGDLQQTAIVIRDEDPIIRLRQASFSVLESDSQYQIFATLSAPSNESITIPLLYRGSATRGIDYAGPSSITIPAGEVSVSIGVSPINDVDFEGDEQIRVYAQSPTSGEFANSTVLTTVLRDDDEPQRLFWTVAEQTVVEGINYTTLQVELTRPASETVSVGVEYIGGSARLGTDFIPTVHSVSIPAGQTKALLDVIIEDDEQSEYREDFRLKLINARNALLPVDPRLHYATVKITDNEILSVSQSLQLVSNLDAYISEQVKDEASEVSNSIKQKLAENQNSIVDAILASADLLVKLIPPPFNIVAEVPVKTTQYLRERYPGTGAAVFDEAGIRADFDRDEWGFMRKLAAEVSKNIMLDYVGSLYDLSFKIFVKVGDWLGENVKLDLQTGHIEIPAWNFNTREITTEKVLDAIDTWDDGASEWLQRNTCSNCGVSGLSINSVVEAVESLFGPSANRTVFVDANFNGSFDPSEPSAVTSIDGRTLIFGMETVDANENGILDPNEGQWIATGGVDVSVDRPIEISSRAPSTFSVITPTSTLITSLLETGDYERSEAGHALAERRVLDALGATNVVTADTNFIVAAANGYTDSALLFARETELYNLVIGISKLFHAAEPSLSLQQYADWVFIDVAEKVARGGSSFRSSIPLVVGNVIEGVSVRSGVQIDASILESVATALANANLQIEQVTPEGSQAFLEHVVRVQQIAQTNLVERIEQLNRGELSAAEFDLLGYASAISSEIETAEIGNITPVYLAAFDAVGRESTGAQNNVFSFTVSAIGESSHLPITVDYEVISQTATAGEDFEAVTGTLTWQPGDLSDRQVEVQVFADSDFENDESFQLVLKDPMNAVLLRSFADGSIINDDSLVLDSANGSQDTLAVSAGSGFAVITRNGEEIFSGSAGQDASITLQTDELDLITVYSDAESSIQLSENYAGHITLSIDSFEIEIDGSPMISGEGMTNVIGLPRLSDLGQSLNLNTVVPDEFLDTSTSISWDLTLDGVTVDSSQGNVVELSSNSTGLHVLTMEIADGYRFTSMSQEVFIGGEGPVAVDDDFVAREKQMLEVDSLLGLLRDDFASPGTTISLTEIDGQPILEEGPFLFETAALNPSLPYLATSLNSDNFYGVRFEVTATTHLDQVGGNFQFFTGTGPFAAVVALDDATDLPDSEDLSTPDVLATTVIPLAFQDDGDKRGAIDVTLQPGWYAVMFGTGKFGSNGITNLFLNSDPVGDQSFIHAQPGVPRFLAPTAASGIPGARFVLEGSTLSTMRTVTLGSGARILANSDGSFSYNPAGAFDDLATGETGVDEFSYTIEDSGGRIDTGRVAISVAGENDAPIAEDDSYFVSEDSLLTPVTNVGILSNDTDVDGRQLRLATVNGQPAGSTLTLSSGAILQTSSEGNFVFDPRTAYDSMTAGQAVEEVFTYTVVDEGGLSSTATVTITINGVDDAPNAVADEYAVAENDSLTIEAPGIIANDRDAEGTELGVTAIEGDPIPIYASYSFATASIDSGSSEVYTVINEGNFYGVRFQVEETLHLDRVGGNFKFLTSTGLFASVVALENENDFPDSFDLSTPDVIASTVIPLAFGSDGNVRADIDAILQPGWYALMLGTGKFGTTGSAGLLLNNSPGEDDSFIHSRLLVPEFREPTVATGIQGAWFALEGRSEAGEISISLASGATVVGLLDGSFSYDPGTAFDYLPEGMSATDQFTYTVTDATGKSSVGTVAMTINGENDPASLHGDLSPVIDEDTDFVAGLLSVDDVDQGEAYVVPSTQIGNFGSLTIHSDGSWIYDLDNAAVQFLNDGDQESDAFQVSSRDGSASAILTFSIYGGDDSDTDGVGDEIERAIGDGNGDGINDSDQDNVASLPSVVSGSNLTIAAANGFTLTNVLSTSIPSFDVAPPQGIEFPIGFTQFTVDVENPGDSTTITIFFDEAESFNAIYKFGVTPDNPTPHYYEFAYDEASGIGAQILSAPSRIVLHLVDGGSGDSDGLVNGSISDPVGLALAQRIGDDYVSLIEDESITVDVRANDVGDGELDIQSITQPEHGTSQINLDGSITYTPALDYFGPDNFQYSVSNNTGQLFTATVYVTVVPANVAPSISGPILFSANEDQGLVLIDLLQGAADIDGDEMSVVGLTHAAGDDAGVTIEGMSLSIDLSLYQSIPSNGHEILEYHYDISDGNGGSVNQSATITIVGVNDAPELSFDLESVTVSEGVIASNTGSWSDLDLGDEVTLSASNGIIVKSSDDRWAWSFESSNGPSESQTIVITADDGRGGISAASFNLNITNVAPTASDATFSIVENSPNGTLIGVVTATDPGADTLEFSITGGSGATAFAIDSASGAISVVDASQLDYETTSSFDLEVTVSDGDGGFDTANVQIDLINMASISGVVFVDVNQNGQFDANEPGINGVVVELRDQNGNAVLDSHGNAINQLTSDGGLYLFEDLPASTYQLYQIQPTGVSDGGESLGSLGGLQIGDDTMQLTISDVDAFDYTFAEIGSQVTSGDTAGIGFWQNKRGRALITSGGEDLAIWLTINFGNIFGDSLSGADGADVARFYRNELFKHRAKKSAGPAKVDAQFMAVALATYFTSSQLAGTVANSYGFNVTSTGIGTRVVNVGSTGAAFGVDDNSELTVMQLLQATNRLTDEANATSGFAYIYDSDGDGDMMESEIELRRQANQLYRLINTIDNQSDSELSSLWSFLTSFRLSC